MSRVAALLAAAVLLSQAASVARATTFDAPPTVVQLVVSLDVLAYEPCWDEKVELAGTMSFQGSTIVSEEGEVELQYALQAIDVHGRGLETGLRYDLAGEAHGVARHLDRVVTADDFRMVTRPEPGVKIHRASAGPRYAITLDVTFSAEGAVETVVPTSVLTDEKCP